MNALKIAPTKTSMEVYCEPESGKLNFSGRSLPENSVGFFKPILEWLLEYAAHPAKHTEVTFYIEYCNSASRKGVIDIFRILDTMHDAGHAITILWKFDDGDDSMREIGEEYRDLFNLEFKFTTI